MSTTSRINKPGTTGPGRNDAQNRHTDTTKPNMTPQAQREDLKDPAGSSPAPTVQHAENYDEAPPGVPGPDYSARDILRKQAKPVFNRGPSMLDFTAVTSAGPTPAGEFPHSGSYFDGSRLRESHLPDEEKEEEEDRLEEEAAAATTRRRRRQTVTEADPEGLGEATRRPTITETDPEGLPRRVDPGGEIRGEDAFAPRASRRETEGGERDETSGWTGAGDTFGAHT